MHGMDHDFGKRLAKARAARGLGIEEAAHATRIRASHIQALEDGNLVKFPNAAYAKSFLVMYARFLGVDVSDVASQIDTSTQMKVEDFQYLTNRAGEEKKLQRDATDTRYDFVVPQKSGGSWMPLIALAGIVVVGVIVFIVWSNFTRIEDSDIKPIPAPAAADTKAAVQSLGDSAPTQKESAPQTEPVPPRPIVISLPPAPEDTEIPRAKPISPVAKIAASDTAALADLTPPSQPAPIASAPPEENNAPDVDADVIVLEPRKKTWVVIRTGPGGQPLFEDFLYPSAKPMHLPAGRYFIELKSADAVEITKNGKRIAYYAPGVVVQ